MRSVEIIFEDAMMEGISTDFFHYCLRLMNGVLIHIKKKKNGSVL